jgi:hypothetical protein
VTLPPTDETAPVDQRQSDNVLLLLMGLIGIAAFVIIAVKANFSSQR